MNHRLEVAQLIDPPTTLSLARLLGYYAFLQAIEELLLLEALKETGGNRNRASKALGLNRTTLVMKIKKFGLRELE